MNKIIIVAESGSDITVKTANKYNIKTVPMHVIMNGESLDDGFFPVDKIFEYYDKHKELPTTSATNPDEYANLFASINKEFPNCQILHLGYSAVTTASFQNAIIGSEEFDNVTHLDTKAVTGGQQAVILKAAKFIKEHPDATIDEVVVEVKKWIDKAYMAFVPNTLNYLLAGGRVSNAAYLGANILKLKPVIEIDNGYLVSKKKYRGSLERASRKLLTDIFENNPLESDSMYLLYSKGLSEEFKLEIEKFLSGYGYNDIPWIATGCVISTHSGPGVFGIGGFFIK